jgi:hypothetical protein
MTGIIDTPNKRTSDHSDADVWRVIGETQKDVSHLATEVSGLKVGVDALANGQTQLLQEFRSANRAKPMRWEAIFGALGIAAYIGWSWIGPIQKDAEENRHGIKESQRMIYRHEIEDAREAGAMEARMKLLEERVGLIDLEGSRRLVGGAR